MTRRTALPALVALLLLAAACDGADQRGAAPTSTPSAAPTTTPPRTPSTAPATTVTPAATAGTRALDASFTSVRDAWVLVRTRSGLRLLRSHDRLATWTTLPVPDVDHVRFASSTTGYAWKQAGRLLLTTDGGRSWRRTSLTLTNAVETAAGTTWALAGDLPGDHVWSAPTGSTRFRDLGLGPNRSQTLDVHGSYAYVVGQQGAGPVAPSLSVGHDGVLRNVPGFPCGADRTYSPTSALGVSTDGSLFLVCVADGPADDSTAWRSRDHGRSWTPARPPAAAVVDATATRDMPWAWGADLLGDEGTRVGWIPYLHGAQGFSLVGFQDDEHAVAVLGNGRLLLGDGFDWRPVRL